MRAIWKGAVSFGLVNVPVRAVLRDREPRRAVPPGAPPGRRPDQVPAGLQHRRRGGRLRRHRQGLRDRGRPDGRPRPTRTSPSCRRAAAARSRSRSSCRPTRSTRCWLEKSYYLEPDKAAAKPYALLRDALKEADRMAVVTVSIRTRMTIAVLRVRDDVIVMQTMLWPDEVRKPGLRQPRRRPSTPPSRRSSRWPTCWSTRWPATTTPDEYEDDYAQAVEAAGPGQARGRRGPGGRRGPPRTAPARWSTCSPRCSAAWSGPRPPAASPPARTRPRTTRPATTRPTTARRTGRAGGQPPARKAPARKAAAKKAAPTKKAAAGKSAPARKTAKKSASGDDAPRKKAAS